MPKHMLIIGESLRHMGRDRYIANQPIVAMYAEREPD
jgi:hypothetical protein